MKHLPTILTVAAASAASVVSANPRSFDFFEKKIRPVLVENCYGCHSADAETVESDYLLDTREGIRRGGATRRDAVIPGDVESSQLIAAIRYDNEDLQMPPDGKLPDEVISNFEKWVEMGAPDPRDGESRLPREIEAESHWSFQPLQETEAPPVRNEEWPRSRLDSFVLARLEKEGLDPVGDADRATLLRRASLELIGLPPTPEELASFLADPAPDAKAFEKVVDRLLADAGFGERWGRHWLDVARYAESSGYSRNMLYPYAWRYRDWVIDAFNEDLPYDEFVSQQIAGDLMQAETADEADSQATATAFLTIGPKTLNEGNPLLFELNVADDQIDATCRAFLALTANCARCHDHKYDPIPTRDYYALAGIFRSSRNLAGVATNVRFEHEDARPLGADGEKRLADIAEAKKRVEEAEATYKELLKVRDAARQPLIDAGIDWKKEPTPELAAAEQKVQDHQDVLRAAKDSIPDPPQFTMSMDDARVINAEKWKEEFDENTKKKLPTDPRIHDSPLYEKGVHNSPGEIVPRGTLSFFSDHLEQRKIGEAESGRLQLAEWLVDEKNPLTARVFVNRVWHHLFGSGLVETVDNFGLLGAEPSHPELLDDLARGFMEDGWSMKRLIRRIILSRTWQLAGTVDEAAHAVDPDVRLLWRHKPQRLEGEAIRDSILAIGGGLDRSRYAGSQVFEISRLQEKAQQREIGRRDFYTTQVDPNVNYRSVYLPMARGAIFDIFKTFDSVDPNLVVGARKEITVPGQALYLMNSDLVREQSESLAKRVVESTHKRSEQTELVFRTIFGRDPTGPERALFDSFFQAPTASSESWALAIQSLICSGEFRTIY